MLRPSALQFQRTMSRWCTYFSLFSVSNCRAVGSLMYSYEVLGFSWTSGKNINWGDLVLLVPLILFLPGKLLMHHWISPLIHPFQPDLRGTRDWDPTWDYNAGLRLITITTITILFPQNWKNRKKKPKPSAFFHIALAAFPSTWYVFSRFCCGNWPDKAHSWEHIGFHADIPSLKKGVKKWN